MIVILFPMSWISSVASAFHDPLSSSLLVWRCGYWWCPCVLSSWRWRRCLLLLLLEERYYQGETVRRIWFNYVPSHRFAMDPRYQRCTIWTFDVFAWHTYWLLRSWYLSLFCCFPYYVVDHSVADVSRSTLLACKVVQTSSVNLGATHACMEWHVLDPRRCPTATWWLQPTVGDLKKVLLWHLASLRHE